MFCVLYNIILLGLELSDPCSCEIFPFVFINTLTIVVFYPKLVEVKPATCNKNEQQQDAKNNAELQTKWTKRTWKIFEETIRRG